MFLTVIFLLNYNFVWLNLGMDFLEAVRIASIVPENGTPPTK